jgi:hypothetical protein
VNGILALYDLKTFTTPKRLYEWHIGGAIDTSVERIKDVMLLHNKNNILVYKL